MTTQFPTMVYKCPGAHKCQGGTYDYKAANDQQQLVELSRSGWHDSLEEALSGLKPGADAVAQASQDVLVVDGLATNSAIIRAWLSAKLNEGGIDHDESMSEDELLFLFCQSFAAVEVDGDNPDEAPPTREELEAKATELGVSFDGRSTDAVLLRRIGAALEQQ